MKIAYKSDDNSYNVTLTYIVQRTNKYYQGIGKSFPITTQCILEINGLVKSFATVTKHHLDKENQDYAYKMVTKKVLTKDTVYFNSIRKGLWNKLFEELNKQKSFNDFEQMLSEQDFEIVSI